MGDLIKEEGTLGGGGPNNSRFEAQRANIMNPTTVDQANQTYGQTQDALAQQQQLAQALQGQGMQGMQNQSLLSSALQQQMNGQGPNPAQAQLAQATGANIANQAALMAGQRGASNNVGLMARQAAQQGAGIQQNAAGQAATLQAQQQLAAQGQLQNLAATQLGQQQGAVGAYNQAAQGLQGNVLNSINAQNTANVGMQANINNANSAMSQTNANNSAKAVSSLNNAVGGVIGGPMGKLFNKGGEVTENKKLAQVPKEDRMPLPDHIRGMAEIHYPGYAYGGSVQSPYTPVDLGSTNSIGNSAGYQMQDSKKPSGGGDTGAYSQEAMDSGQAMTSGPDMLSGQAVGGAAEGGAGAGAIDMIAANPEMALVARGGQIPGKPKVKGDSPKNDTVPAALSPGEVVIPNHVMESDDPAGNAAKFVQAILEKHGKPKAEEDDFKEALKSAISSRKKK